MTDYTSIDRFETVHPTDLSSEDGELITMRINLYGGKQK